MFEPPWIHTRTGKGAASRGRFGVQTFSVKQSSLSVSPGVPSTLTGCMQGCPNCVASRSPDTGRWRTGGFQRSGPIGGAAYGIPLNAASLGGQCPSTDELLAVRCHARSGLRAGVQRDQQRSHQARQATHLLPHSRDERLIHQRREPRRDIALQRQLLNHENDHQSLLRIHSVRRAVRAAPAECADRSEAVGAESLDR